VRAAAAAYDDGRAPINAVEGFVRQILGWREFVRGIYWLRMPGYAASNALGAGRPLPGFYWTGETDMNCLARAIAETRANAYAHHIQRLMVTGNFALLAGIAPAEVEAWYLAVYADAFEWVELPNTHGMALYADGGLLASKPYAASGKYIDRMSDYCRGCAYDVARSDGDGACPLNFLYWNFMMENESRLRGNPRMAMPYRTLAKFAPERRARLRADAARFRGSLA
jgi:deoxyribodipyrimidine photolyase-related protein